MHTLQPSCLQAVYFLVTFSPALLFMAIFVIKMLIYVQISTTVLFKVNLCLSSKKTNNTYEKNPEAKVENRKNKIMFFNTWFILLFSRIISILLPFENTLDIVFRDRGKCSQVVRVRVR